MLAVDVQLCETSRVVLPSPCTLAVNEAIDGAKPGGYNNKPTITKSTLLQLHKGVRCTQIERYKHATCVVLRIL